MKMFPKLQDWQQKESELLKKIAELETVKKERTEESLKFELKVSRNIVFLILFTVTVYYLVNEMIDFLMKNSSNIPLVLLTDSSRIGKPAFYWAIDNKLSVSLEYTVFRLLYWHKSLNSIERDKTQ